ncbi:MAG TPA: helix-turn-helix domain-containing protein [Woeseiaceae bacterium]
MSCEHPIEISVLAVPDAFMSSLMGFVDTLTLPGHIAPAMPFSVQVVARELDTRIGPRRMPMRVDSTLDAVRGSDVVIVPALVFEMDDWVTGRYPQEVAWLRRMHAEGATVCSACSGSLLLAEAGLLDGKAATSHWDLAPVFKRLFPAVALRLDREIVITGDENRLVMSGAAAAWHDLAMYLVARFCGPAIATAVAKFFMLQWHSDGQAPYRMFRESLNHGDAAVLRAQAWLQDNWQAPRPVEGMINAAGISERNFKRRFRKATDQTPIRYVQLVRVENAKQRLEHSHDSIDEICAQVGYEDASYFRRLFKRITGMTPGNYRRKFRIPAYVPADLPVPLQIGNRISDM